ncbi:MAG TPA: hypothetical protein P5154_01230 [Candidatus Izemoplasmatales bacterium]|nr:hypothetical protein [Candidatus Izemoplasmatales bacterium]
MTIRKFRIIDLAILTAAGLLPDVLIPLIGLPRVGVYVSISIPVILFCLVRWQRWGLLPLGILTLAQFLIGLWDNPATASLAHAAGMAGLSAGLLIPSKWFIRPRTGFGKVSLYYLTGYVSMVLLEWVIFPLLHGGIPLENVLLKHAFNFFLGYAIFAVIARQKDLLVPMEPYLREEARKREEEKMRKGIGLYDEDPEKN